jgi:hypothetical protein
MPWHGLLNFDFPTNQQEESHSLGFASPSQRSFLFFYIWRLSGRILFSNLQNFKKTISV